MSVREEWDNWYEEQYAMREAENTCCTKTSKTCICKQNEELQKELKMKRLHARQDEDRITELKEMIENLEDRLETAEHADNFGRTEDTCEHPVRNTTAYYQYKRFCACKEEIEWLDEIVDNQRKTMAKLVDEWQACREKLAAVQRGYDAVYADNGRLRKDNIRRRNQRDENARRIDELEDVIRQARELIRG